MKIIFKNKSALMIALVTLLMLSYFVLAHPTLNDDGFQYEGFAESAARGHVDFKNFYGFQGLSFLSVPIFWLTHSKISIVITSAILFLISIPLAYLIGRDYYKSKKAGLFFMALILLMPYPYTTMMRGFQEAALLFFILLIIYGSLGEKIWTPVAWAVGGIVKPFALVLFSLFTTNFLTPHVRKLVWVFAALLVGGLYLGTSYYQTGYLVNNAAINSYQGNFDTGHPPPLNESFVLSWRGYARVLANLFIYSRKILLSPLVILLGAVWLWYKKTLPLRKEIILAILLNLLLVGSLTFSFQKYLLPMTVLLSLVSVSVLLKSRILQFLVLVDSVFVFSPIYSYFGHNFWSSRFVFHLPLILAGLIFFITINAFDDKKTGR